MLVPIPCSNRSYQPHPLPFLDNHHSSRGSFRPEPRAKQQAPPEWARWADPEEVKAADSGLDADARWAEKVGDL